MAGCAQSDRAWSGGFQLHEAEGSGVDTITMHVQADASSQIQHYSDKASRVSFILLGYWTGTTYVERFDAFKAGASASWQSHALGYLRCRREPGSRDRAIANQHLGRVAGRRARARVHPGAATTACTKPRAVVSTWYSMMVGSDASSMIEVYAEADSVVDFHLLGYWSTPPGTYIESGGVQRSGLGGR